GALTSSNDGPAASPSASGSTSVSAAKHQNQEVEVIIGGVIGGVAFLLSVFLGVVLVLRRRKTRRPSQGEFRREMMVLNTVEAIIDKRSPSGPTDENRYLEVDPISSTTPLRESFVGDEDHRSSFATSFYSRSSASKRSVAVSGISSISSAPSKEAPDIPKLPLILVSENPPLSPAHLKMPSRARTDRQMQIEEKIIELQGRFITASGSEGGKTQTRAELQERIEKLKALRESEWAHGGKGEIPEVLVD
ncbi:hypothetical protein PQX77_001135, partial [Marasmius sp. AFHP31]